MNRAIFLVTGIFLTAIAFAVPSGLGAGIRDDATQAKLSALSKEPLAANVVQSTQDATQAKLSALSKDPLAANVVQSTQAEIAGQSSVVESTSGSDFNWSLLGTGFGIGVLLVGGLILTVQFTRHQRLAH